MSPYCFPIGRPVESFHRPREARDTIAGLLSDDARRRSIAAAARARVEPDHSWDSRLQRLLACAGLAGESFQTSSSAAS